MPVPAKRPTRVNLGSSLDIPTHVYLGVDPGASGGLAEIGCVAGKSTYVKLVPMPATERDIWGWFEERSVGVMSLGDEVFAVLEKVSGYIGEAQPGSTAFKLGASYGMLKMALTAAGIPYEEVTPQRWQKALGIPTRKKDETRTQWKNRLKQHAERLFPLATPTLATADAALLAEYCRRLREGKLNER